jgi:YD repeat-containing protein
LFIRAYSLSVQFIPHGYSDPKFEYDQFDRLVATILPMGQRNQTVYDKFGRVEQQQDFNGDKITYGYDSYGRLETKGFSDARLTTVAYAYDPVSSQLANVTDGRGVTRYGYDRWDRLETVTQPDQQFVRYGYDLLSNVTSLRTKAGTTSYDYDRLNRLEKVKEGDRTLVDYDLECCEFINPLRDKALRPQKFALRIPKLPILNGRMRFLGTKGAVKWLLFLPENAVNLCYTRYTRIHNTQIMTMTK